MSVSNRWEVATSRCGRHKSAHSFQCVPFECVPTAPSRQFEGAAAPSLAPSVWGERQCTLPTEMSPSSGERWLRFSLAYRIRVKEVKLRPCHTLEQPYLGQAMSQVLEISDTARCCVAL